MNSQLLIPVTGQGLYDITAQVMAEVRSAAVVDGLATLFIQHTSASLLIQENADPAVQVDLQNWLNRLVVENDPLYTHVEEGPDDMPAHIKSALTAVSLSIPIMQGNLVLGVWQGIYLWEHRHNQSNSRKVVLNIQSG
ncbi:MAG: YjbQ family protein [Gammaproteobacteria bacterium TMED92]|nr:MAG: YjbQ family protein [Gammaproteobacteria bacterium TMED92]